MTKPKQSNFKSGQTIKLGDLAFARSGDKGDMVNIALIAHHTEDAHWLEKTITPTLLAEWFEGWSEGPFEVWPVPGVGAVNCLIHRVLQGGGAVARRLDAQGKALGQAVLQANITLP